MHKEVKYVDTIAVSMTTGNHQNKLVGKVDDDALEFSQKAFAHFQGVSWTLL